MLRQTSPENVHQTLFVGKEMKCFVCEHSDCVFCCRFVLCRISKSSGCSLSSLVFFLLIRHPFCFSNRILFLFSLVCQCLLPLPLRHLLLPHVIYLLWVFICSQYFVSLVLGNTTTPCTNLLTLAPLCFLGRKWRRKWLNFWLGG